MNNSILSAFMSRLLALIVFVAVIAHARAPLESYKRYMIMMVHGIGGNTMQPHDYNAYERESETDVKRKSAIFDRSADDNRPILDIFNEENWHGKLGETLHSRGFLGHTVWYDFYEPWQSPIYDPVKYPHSLSRYLGDRSINNNPMGEEQERIRYSYFGNTFQNRRELYWHLKLLNLTPLPEFFSEKKSEEYFGQTAQSYWLRRLFPSHLNSIDTVKYARFEGPFLDLAEEDWKQWGKLRYGIADTVALYEEKPKKYILIGHSMGGLTTRDYITGPFYKGDVDKLITLDSPHEGSAIANYVQYWHKNKSWSWADTLEEKFNGQGFLHVISYLDDAFAVANLLAICLSPDYVKEYGNMIMIYSILKAPSLIHSISAGATSFLNDYSTNQYKTGKPFTEQGIEVMKLKEGSETKSNPNDFLKKFNNREKLQDPYKNDYSLPYFRLVSTSGVPTPGGHGMHKAMTIPYANAAALLHGIWPAFAGEKGTPEVSTTFLRLTTALGAQSLWNDWGSGFVPTWSAKADNVRVFNSSEANTKKINIPFLKSDEKNDDGLKDWAFIIASTAALELLASQIPGDNCGMKALRYFVYGAAAVTALALVKDTDLNRLFDYIGFHGAMMKRVEEDSAPSAPSGRGSDKKIIDELLWERPSVSFTYNPVEAWDYSQGGYVGIGTNKEQVSFTATNPGTKIPVKWIEEDNPQVFEINLTNAEEGTEELIRNRTIYIAGKTAGTKFEKVTLIDEEGNETAVTQCENIVGFANGTVNKDNEGLIACDTQLPAGTNGRFTLKIDAYHANGNGALLVNIGRQPGKAFVSGNAITKAEGVDWDRYLTFKNRRPQKKVNVAGIPTEEQLDKTIAEIVDYHKSPLLVVNTIPRYFELEIDELQPDRMNKLNFSFNFGTASVSYEAVNDPNKFNQVPSGFSPEDAAKGMVDPSKEDYKVTVQLGATVKTATIKNPINAWGHMTLDFDKLENLLEMDKGSLQPFLEGRNHLRIYSENRWQMNRVQEMNLFIPGPPPTVTPIFPMADEYFCGSSYLEFETDLIYGMANNLAESDITVSYVNANSPQFINEWDIESTTSRTKYKVKSKTKINWPANETGVQIKVTPRINGTPSNPINYQYMIRQDCIAPTLAFAEDQEKFNPTAIRFDAYDLEKEDGDLRPVQDLLLEFYNTDSTSILLSAERFASAGAKVRNLIWKNSDDEPFYPDGKYKLTVRAHDNTIKNSDSDLQRKAFWESYDENGNPDLSHPFASYCKGENCHTQWGKDEIEIVLDFTPPEITSLQYTPTPNANGMVVYAGNATKENFSLTVSATDVFSTEENPVKAMLEMYPADISGNEIEGTPFFMELELKAIEDTRFDFKDTIIKSHDAFTRSLTGGAQTFIEGIYNSKIVAQDAAGNKATSPVTIVIVDLTAPRILNANVPYSPLPGSEHIVRFNVDELDDAPSLRNISPETISAKVSAKCNQGIEIPYSLQAGEKQGDTINYRFAATIPEGLQGECMVLIEAFDARGNVRRSENKIVVDLIPPEITSPKNGDISGQVAIYGVADNPSLSSGDDFAWYSLSYAPVDAEGNILGIWKTAGISIPDAQQCIGEPSRGCKPVSRFSKSNILGYWNTNVLSQAERSHTYRLKLVVTNISTTLDTFVDIFVPEQEKVDLKIDFDNLPLNFDFSNESTLPISWNVTASPSNDTYQVRLEISRLNAKQEKTATVVNRLFEGVVPKMYYGEPINASEQGIYLWLGESEQVVGETRYRIRLVAKEETKFNLSFIGGVDATLSVVNNSGEVPEGVTVTKNSFEMGYTASISRTVRAGSSEEFILSTNSKTGIDWVLMSLNDPNTIVDAFIGQNKFNIGSAGVSHVRLPSLIGGKGFDWKGIVDGSGANVPSGVYRIKATLEGLNDNLTATTESILEITGAPVNITDAKVTPGEISFNPEISPVMRQITLSFKIDQDALLSVFVRSRDGTQNIKETMNLSLDGHDLLLDKQLLAGRSTAYTVRWNGVYNRNMQLPPNDEGYEFVIQAYDLSGKFVEKEVVVPFEVVPHGMTEDKSNVALWVDGDSDKRINFEGVSYQIAQGLNDLMIEATPVGYRVVRDAVDVTLGYKGTQSAATLPFERYSIGVQIHKKSIEFWAVVAATFRFLYESEQVCNEETKISRQVGYKSVRFAEEGVDAGVRTLEWDFHENRGSDMNGRMDNSNVHLLLIPKAKMTEVKLKSLIKNVNDAKNVSDKNTNWNKLKDEAELDFLWVPNGGGEVFVENQNSIGGLISSGRESWNNWKERNSGTVPEENSTSFFWDENDPEYDPAKHAPEMTAKAWAWKHTDGQNKVYDPWGCLGCSSCRKSLRYFFELEPTNRFWANPNKGTDYGWNNSVNRYVTLDPLNQNFLFGTEGYFKDIKAPFINPQSEPVIYKLNNPTPANSQYFFYLLSNINFQAHQHIGSDTAVTYTGALESDVEMILHFFKGDPSSRKYYPASFAVNVLANGSSISSRGFSDNANSHYSQPIPIGNSPRELAVSIKMEDSPIYGYFPDIVVPWPTTQASITSIQNTLCKTPNLCGADENDKEVDTRNIEFINADEIVNGFRQIKIPVAMDRLDDNSSGFDLSPYIKKTGISYTSRLGNNPEIIITNKETVTINSADNIKVPPDYYVDNNSILRREGAEKGYQYVVADDPLMRKIEDDEGGSPNVVRLRVPGVFPFVSGGSSPLLLSYNLMEEIGKKADAEGFVPVFSNSAGWSLFKKNGNTWQDYEDILTQWEESPSVFERTRLLYKDGTEHKNVKIHSAEEMDNWDYAGRAKLYLAPAPFDGYDRRVLKIRGSMPWRKGDTYKVFASSDAGWQELTLNESVTSYVDRLSGTFAYWDVRTSGFHQLLLLRNAGGMQYYKVFPVAIGSGGAGTGTFGDAMGRVQLTADNLNFVDVVPLGSKNVPQSIPGDASMGPVVQVYPPIALSGQSITLRIRYTREEIETQGWTEDASIYVVSEGYSPQRLSAVTWAFYSDKNEKVETNLGSSNWEYAVISGVLQARPPMEEEVSSTHSLGQASQLTEGTTVTVQETAQDVFTVTIDKAGEK
ncbi:MAG: GPI inositol-deacylase [Fibromonadaceae bacterium]|jgi:hypothetical protein|nr:GPI inositol-deacylase [Fibromonadaceae bacterium]